MYRWKYQRLSSSTYVSKSISIRNLKKEFLLNTHGFLVEVSFFFDWILFGLLEIIEIKLPFRWSRNWETSLSNTKPSNYLCANSRHYLICSDFYHFSSKNKIELILWHVCTVEIEKKTEKFLSKKRKQASLEWQGFCWAQASQVGVREDIGCVSQKC